MCAAKPPTAFQSHPLVVASGLGPVYALQTDVFTDDNVTSDVTLIDTLDVTSLSTATAREYPGYAFITGVDGKPLVSDVSGSNRRLR